MSSTRRTVSILDLLARRGPLGVRAVAQQLKLPLGSVHRILLDLAEEMVVERTADGDWDLSHRLFEITGRQLERIQLPRLARPFAERMAEATGETVNLYLLSAGASVCIDKIRGNEAMQLDARIGSSGLLTCGGAGKAMLAYMSNTEWDRLLAAPLVRLTANTITDPDALRRELVRIRGRGYSIDDQEVVAGVYCVSVPILDRSERPIAALSITGPLPKAPGPKLDGLLEMLVPACGHVSRKLGYTGQWPPVESASSQTLRRKVG